MSWYDQRIIKRYVNGKPTFILQEKHILLWWKWVNYGRINDPKADGDHHPLPPPFPISTKTWERMWEDCRSRDDLLNQ